MANPANVLKLIQKAQQAKGRMKKVTAAGRSKDGSVAVLLNGLNEIEEISISPELIAKNSSKAVENAVVEAYNDARKQLEKVMAQSMNMDEMRDMLSF